MSGAQGNVEHAAGVKSSSRRESEAPSFSGIWALTMILALIYVMAGVPKVGAFDFIAARFEEVWGYPDWFRTLIGGLEFIGGVFLIIPSTAFYAASMLGGIMLGAMYTHLALGNPSFAPIPAICLILLMIVAYTRRPDYLRDGA